MASMKEVYRETDELIRTIGLNKTKEKVTDIVKYTKNSVVKTFWSIILDNYIPSIEDKNKKNND